MVAVNRKQGVFLPTPRLHVRAKRRDGRIAVVVEETRLAELDAKR
jgi:hypothetical protein